MPDVKQLDPTRVSFSGKQMVFSITLLIRPVSMMSSVSSSRQRSIFFLNLKICVSWLIKRLSIFSNYLQMFLIFAWNHFTAFCLFDTFSMSVFFPKPLWFIFVIKHHLKPRFIHTALFWCDKPKTINYCRLNINWLYDLLKCSHIDEILIKWK